MIIFLIKYLKVKANSESHWRCWDVATRGIYDFNDKKERETEFNADSLWSEAAFMTINTLRHVSLEDIAVNQQNPLDLIED